MMTMNRFAMGLVTVSIALAGCSQPIETQSPLTAMVATSPTFAPSATPTDEPTARPTHAMATKTPTFEPSATAVLILTTQPMYLNEREPSLERLQTYLQTTFPHGSYNLFDAKWGTSDSELTYPDLNGDGKPDLLITRNYEEVLRLIYQDINGDNVDDMIVLAPPEIFVLIWLREHYAEPFELMGKFWWGIPYSQVEFDDWTNDGKPEVVFDDEEFFVHGTGIYGTFTTRYIILCEGVVCKTIWQGEISRDVDDSNFGGLARYKADMNLTTDETGKLALRYLYHGFSVHCCSFIDEVPRLSYFSSLKVTTSTLSISVWTGSTFELSSEQVVSLPYTIDSQASLTSTSQTGTVTTLSVRNHRFPETYFENDVCQLSIADGAVGAPFGCKQNFTTVEWKDITGDGQEDVVVIALSGMFTTDGEFINDIRCVHQRVLAYQWNGTTATQIANITGCVVREDLYGVRLEDFDQDGQLEILAAADREHTLDQIYKWNGARFVFWDDVPGQ